MPLCLSSPQGLLALVRASWLLVIANLMLVFARPALFFRAIDELGPTDELPGLAQGRWSWDDCPMWLLPLGALAAPALMHRFLLARCPPAYDVVRSSEPGGGYRAAPRLQASIRPDSVRRRSAIYCLRLAFAVGLCAVPLHRLYACQFIENYGCILHEVSSVPVYTVQATLVLAALFFHAPTTRRLLG